MKAPMYIGTSPWGSNFNIDLNKKSFKKKIIMNKIWNAIVNYMNHNCYMHIKAKQKIGYT